MILFKSNISRYVAVAVLPILLFLTNCTSSYLKNSLIINSNTIPYNSFSEKKLIIKGTLELKNDEETYSALNGNYSETSALKTINSPCLKKRHSMHLCSTTDELIGRLPTCQSQNRSKVIINASLPLNYQRELRTGKAATIKLSEQIYKAYIIDVRVDGLKNKIDFELALNTSSIAHYQDKEAVTFELKLLSPELISGIPQANACWQTHSSNNMHR